MRRYILQRLKGLIPLCLCITFLAFVLTRIAPGGPFDRERAPASPEIEKALQERYHLDESWLMQYGRFLAGLARGDLGPSFLYRNHTVNEIILQGLPISMTLGGLAFVFAMGVGIPWGFWSAKRKGEWDGKVAHWVSLLAICLPGFVLGPVLVLVFAIYLGWFPVGLWETVWHWVLPVVTLGIYYAGKVARLAREGLLEILSAPYLRTARAKGLGEGTILFRHAARLALLPVVSYAGPLMADLLTGSFVVENLFQIPGLGTFMVNSSLNRDYPTVVGLVLLYAFLVLVLNLVVDIFYAGMDPRVRYETAPQR